MTGPRVGSMGWLHWPPATFVRFELEESGRLSAAAVFVEPGDGAALSASTLRRLPLSRIEAAVAGGPLRDELLATWNQLPKPHTNLRALAFLQTAVQMHDAHDATSERDARLRVLERPGRTPDDEFYATVAEQYRLRSETSHAPASVLAGEAGVPVGTVHRWVREARRRGHLPPGRPGRAG